MSPADWEADVAASALCGALSHREIAPEADPSMNPVVGMRFQVTGQHSLAAATASTPYGFGSFVP
jgi:hypothetical protein